MRWASPQSPSLGTKLSVLAFLLSVGLGVGWMAWRGFSDRKITDQELLREAVAEWKKAGEPGNGPNYQIIEQQAAQGYYDDAAATGRLFKRADDVQWSIVELVKIRTENGDIQGAKDSIRGFAGSDLQKKASRSILWMLHSAQPSIEGSFLPILPRVVPVPAIFEHCCFYRTQRPSQF
jgi:hypothetical protein